MINPRRLLRFFGIRHRHAWTDTRTNPWFIAVEQQCSLCKRYRYHRFKDLRGFHNPPRWHGGRHPHNRTLKPSR